MARELVAYVGAREIFRARSEVRGVQTASRSTRGCRARRTARALAVGALVAAAPACAPPDDDAAVDAALEATTSATHEGVFVVAATDTVAPMASPVDAAIAARMRFRALFPRCAEVPMASAADPTLVTVRFDNCGAVFQWWTRVSGVLTLRFDAAAPEGLQIRVQATGLRVNGGVLTTDATVVRTVTTPPGGEPVVSVAGEAQSSWTGPRGTVVRRSGAYALSWERAVQCLGLDGRWTVEVRGETLSADVSRFRQCGAHCPQAGGRVEIVRRNGEQISVSYPGGATAEWAVTPPGDGGSVQPTRGGTTDLACTP